MEAGPFLTTNLGVKLHVSPLGPGWHTKALSCPKDPEAKGDHLAEPRTLKSEIGKPKGQIRVNFANGACVRQIKIGEGHVGIRIRQHTPETPASQYRLASAPSQNRRPRACVKKKEEARKNGNKQTNLQKKRSQGKMGRNPPRRTGGRGKKRERQLPL